MYTNLFQTSFLFFLVIISSLLHHLPTSSCNDDVNYVACAGWFHCANIPSLGYPFWRDGRPEHCGHPGFRLNCENDVPILSIQSTPYRVLGIDTRALLLTVTRQDIWNNTCPKFLYNTSLDYKLFSHPSGDQNLTLYYGCTTLPIQGLHLPNEFNCTVNETTSDSYFVTKEASIVPNPNLVNCSQSLTVPVNETAALALTPPTSVGVLRETLASGFGLLWEANDTYCNECARSSGRCGYNSSSGSFACYCVDGPYPFVCNETDSNSSSNPKTLHIVFPVIGAIFAGIGIGWLIFFCRQRRKRRLAAQNESKDVLTDSTKGLFTTPSTNFTQSIPSYPSLKSMVGKGSTYFGAQVFSYTELEQATDNFSPSKELGEGGFGTVYYGTLHDGRVVAVKRLYENNFKRLEQFMNEVEILTRLQHANLVKLYGCTSKRSRELLLVYEYIPNGTVADHLHGKQASSGFLSWPVRMNIAIETAEALAYLHASDIIHRDVKTNNILLDKNFCVKVADFGLSRLFPNDATHVSTAPQGTPGYVDPEYYRMYKLTDKSDVYSFGVVLIELISSLQAVDTNRHRHDINLANMAINKIQNQSISELVDQNLGYEADASVRKMTIMVAELAFRCLQEDNDMRPSMKEVVDTLRSIQNEKEFDARKVEALEILVDDSAPLKGKDCPISPDSVADKWISSNSTSISSG